VKGSIIVSKKKDVTPEEIVDTVSNSEETVVEHVEAEDIEMVLEEEMVETIEVVSLEQQLEAKEAEVKEQVDRLHRTMAEFDNFRKRTIKEKAQMYEKGAKDVLEVLLPIVDNFERAFLVSTKEHQEDPFVKGIDMIYKQLVAGLNDIGVEEIEAKDQAFDTNLHHAVQHEESEDHEANMVTEVYQKGYMYKDTVLRHSMVKVVN
jgi:molecular chaperone GrpE